MPCVDIVVESVIQKTVRTQQLEAMFDVPPQVKSRKEWHVDLPIDEDDWQIGLIVGPSGCGKSQIGRKLWGERVDSRLKWSKGAVVDSFAKSYSMEEISQVCMAVGFNTIPSWLLPFSVLSNGEQFRVEMARRLLEGGELVVVDEFTSVVDRQVAKIAAHAVQKFVRKKTGKKFVGITCHYDVAEWLLPDWIYDPSTAKFARGCLQQRRPDIDITISPVPYSTWQVFAPFHYLTASLHRGARCFALFVDGRLASFAGMLHRCGRSKKPIMGCSRMVTLPDFQGLGLAFVLIDTLGSLYGAIGKHVHTYPAHPSLIRGLDRSPIWEMRKKPGQYRGSTTKEAAAGRNLRYTSIERGETKDQSGRPCAVFRYRGPTMPIDEAEAVFDYWRKGVD